MFDKVTVEEDDVDAATWATEVIVPFPDKEMRGEPAPVTMFFKAEKSLSRCCCSSENFEFI